MDYNDASPDKGVITMGDASTLMTCLFYGFIMLPPAAYAALTFRENFLFLRRPHQYSEL